MIAASLNGVVWVPVLCSPLFVAVWSCLRTAKRDDVDLVAHEADRPWDATR